jgi:hypothetical protein
MTEIQDVTGTAFIVAEYRAQENAEQDPLYRDPIVPVFLSERTGKQPIALPRIFRQVCRDLTRTSALHAVDGRHV